MSSYHPLGGPSTDAANAPVTRSRTLFYLSVRDSSTFGAPPHRRPPTSSAAQYGDIGDEDDERGGLLAGQSGSGGVQLGPGAGLPPKW
jgi:syntaxin 16